MDSVLNIFAFLGASFVCWCIGTLAKEFALSRRDDDMPAVGASVCGIILGVVSFLFLFLGGVPAVIIYALSCSSYDRAQQDGVAKAHETSDPLIESLTNRIEKLDSYLEDYRQENRRLRDELNKLRADHL